jgi:hypothetical protein
VDSGLVIILLPSISSGAERATFVHPSVDLQLVEPLVKDFSAVATPPRIKAMAIPFYVWANIVDVFANHHGTPFPYQNSFSSPCRII